MRVLVINAGSTTVKLSVLEGEAEQFAITVEHESPAKAVGGGLEQIRAKGLLPVEAVGHRIVHGGAIFTRGVRVTDDLLAKLAELSDLAPLHNPPALEALSESRKQLPDVPHIATFDTAFHRTIPPEAFTYPVPRKWTEEWSIRKFGFHGLSHEYCSRRAAEMLGRVGDPEFRVVVAHLGGGCSAAAIKGGQCVDTTMGFTPMDGLMMATRCGSIDPGVIAYVIRKQGLSSEQVEHLLETQSGLLGVSGVSRDLREVEASARVEQDSALAIEMFVYRVRLGIASMVAALRGADCVVFTAGIGEHDAGIRARTSAALAYLGLSINPQLNESCQSDLDISAEDTRCRVLVIHTREDVSIVREIERVLTGE